MIEELGARLREERRSIGLDQRAFAELAGVNKNTQLAYEQGKTAPDANYLMRIAEHGADIGYILTGKRGEHSFSVGDAAGDAAERLGLAMIPEADITYSMGGGAVVDDYVETRMVPFRRDWLARLTRGGPADVFLTRGQGDSMMPTILDDDDVLVNRADNAIRQQDRIWALGYGELGMIKRVRRLPSGLFQLNSDNPSVTPIESTEDELHIVGRVIWIGRRV